MKRPICMIMALALCATLLTPALAAEHTVAPGESLWSIAQKELGNGMRWGEVYEANKNIIKNPNLIYSGQVLTIPEDVPTETPVPDRLEPYVIELDPQYNVPTQELLKSFPITYQTPAVTPLEQNVQNRMLNGFNRWNMGYEAWEHWGEVLYHTDSIYNVHGVRLTLAEYQQAMNASLMSTDIQMGNFNNMILSDDWMAIRYDVINTNKKTGETTYGTTMEFARFGDYGEKGAKVDEGWGGIKGQDYTGLMNFQTQEEKAAQEAFMQAIIDIQLPETNNLEEKYPVLYPTTIDTELGKTMKAAVLNDFEHWNNGYDDWATWADEFYTADVMYDLDGTECDLNTLKDIVRDTIDQTKRVQINNILVSENWAAIHFWTVTTGEDGTQSADNHMQFLHFVEENGEVKVDLCWAK